MKIDYDSLAEVFDGTRSQSKELLEAVTLGISTIVSGGERILDIGCGTGRFLLPISRTGAISFGIDISPKMLQKARGKGLENLARADAAALPFADGSFKASLVTNVLHLVPEWKGLMSEACRVSSRAVLSFKIDRGDGDPIAAFKSIMDRMGIAQPRAGPLESELMEQCKPEFVIELGGYMERMAMHDILSAFEMRTYTFQSELTDEQNRACMEEYASMFKGEEVSYANNVAMIVWHPMRLRKEIERATFDYPQARTF